MRIRVGSREIETPTLGESLRRGYESYQAVSSAKREAESLSLLRQAEARKASVDAARDELQLNLTLKSAAGRATKPEVATLHSIQGASANRIRRAVEDYQTLLDGYDSEDTEDSDGSGDSGGAVGKQSGDRPTYYQPYAGGSPIQDSGELSLISGATYVGGEANNNINNSPTPVASQDYRGQAVLDLQAFNRANAERDEKARLIRRYTDQIPGLFANFSM